MTSNQGRAHSQRLAHQVPNSQSSLRDLCTAVQLPPSPPSQPIRTEQDPLCSCVPETNLPIASAANQRFTHVKRALVDKKNSCNSSPIYRSFQQAIHPQPCTSSTPQESSTE